LFRRWSPAFVPPALMARETRAARVSNVRSGFDLGKKGWGVGIGGVGIREGLYMVYGIGSEPLDQMISTAWI